MTPMSEQKPTQFNFWSPTSATGVKVMVWVLVVIGFLGFIKGCVDERLVSKIRHQLHDPGETFFSIVFFYVVLNVAETTFQALERDRARGCHRKRVKVEAGVVAQKP